MAGDKIDISPEQDGSLLKEIRRPGQAGQKPWKGDRVTVHYVGTLADNGEKFDASRDRDEPFKFSLGKGEVIKGWDIGVASMDKGELAFFTIKAEKAYGENGSPPKIPGGATLNFEVELLDFEGEDITKDKDKGVIKRTLETGEGLDHPNEESTLVVALRGEHNGKVVDEREITFSLGEGSEHGIPKGVELALHKMKKQEKSRLTIQPEYAFASAGDPDKQIPPEAVLDYEVQLKTFERAKESWQLDGDQKLEQSRLFKDRGTNFFKQSKFELASKKYKKIIEFLEHEISLKGEQEEERRTLLQAGRLNLAACHLKLQEWIDARNVCEKVIEENAQVAKAYFRRGEAFMHLKDFEEAKKDFQRVINLEPDNKAAKNKSTVCLQEIKKQKEKEKKTFANMFDKFAKADAKKEEEARKNQKPLEINEWESKNNEKNAGDTINVTGDVKMDIDLNKEMAGEQ